MPSGGLSRLNLKPLGDTSENNPTVRGSHRGRAAGLNVHNPQPGFIYKWIRHPRHDRGGAQYRRFVNMGYEVVGANSPERRAEAGSLKYHEVGLDNYQTHGDLLLIRIPEGKYRELQEFREQQRKVALEGVTDGYLSRGKELESRLGVASTSDQPLYYRGRDHGEVSR